MVLLGISRTGGRPFHPLHFQILKVVSNKPRSAEPNIVILESNIWSRTVEKWATVCRISSPYLHLKHFFWPGLKSDVVQYCHVCQITGKPNEIIPPAPLCPIPVVEEPFQKVIVDCVGPLPKSKTGNQFLLTVMCVSTRFLRQSHYRGLQLRLLPNLW